MPRIISLNQPALSTSAAATRLICFRYGRAVVRILVLVGNGADFLTLLDGSNQLAILRKRRFHYRCLSCGAFFHHQGEIGFRHELHRLTFTFR